MIFAILACPFAKEVEKANVEEIRALWVDSWGAGFLTPKQTDKLLKDAWTGNYNTLLVEVRKVADAYYKSAHEPRANNLMEGYDPLADLIKKAARPPQGKNPLEIHAWIVVNRVGKRFMEHKNPKALINAHPDWLMRTYDGDKYLAESLYADPANPEYITHTAKVVTDLVGNYKIDGLHLDYIRYPEGGAWGYSGVSRKRYQLHSGKAAKPKPKDKAWQDWRRTQNSLLVRRIAAEALTIRPDLWMSAAVITFGATNGGNFKNVDAYTSVYQDWPMWCETGWLDVLYPMNYKRDSSKKQQRDYRQWIDVCRRYKGPALLVPGQAAYLNTLVGSRHQMLAVRSRGADGISTYSYRSYCSSKNVKRSEFLAEVAQRYSKKATIPIGHWRGKRRIVSGFVSSPSGKPADAAQVTATVSGKEIKTITDASGFYAFLNLGIGPVQINAFQGKLTSKAVQVNPRRGETVRKDIQLRNL
jgi:uncharacterized lipoprotein YddW (UPF0748 family)